MYTGVFKKSLFTRTLKTKVEIMIQIHKPTIPSSSVRRTTPTLFTARDLRSNLARSVMERRQHCYPIATALSWREKYAGICPKPSKQMAMGTESIMTIGTSMGRSEPGRGLKNALPWLPFLMRHIGVTGGGQLPGCCQREKRWPLKSRLLQPPGESIWCLSSHQRPS